MIEDAQTTPERKSRSEDGEQETNKSTKKSRAMSTPRMLSDSRSKKAPGSDPFGSNPGHTALPHLSWYSSNQVLGFSQRLYYLCCSVLDCSLRLALTLGTL
jgi:hypothetical protein